MAGLWLAGEVVNHVGIYGSKAAEGLSAFQRRSCTSWFFQTNYTSWYLEHFLWNWSQVNATGSHITWTSVDPDLCCHMASLSHNELIVDAQCLYGFSEYIIIAVICWRSVTLDILHNVYLVRVHHHCSNVLAFCHLRYTYRSMLLSINHSWHLVASNTLCRWALGLEQEIILWP